MKRVIAFLLSFILAMSSVAIAEDMQSLTRIHDYVGVIPEEDMEGLEFSAYYDMMRYGGDFAAIIFDNYPVYDEEEYAILAEAFWEDQGYGYDDEHSGMLLMLNLTDPDDPYFFLYLAGKMDEYMTVEQYRRVHEDIQHDLDRGNIIFAIYSAQAVAAEVFFAAMYVYQTLRLVK